MGRRGCKLCCLAPLPFDMHRKDEVKKEKVCSLSLLFLIREKNFSLLSGLPPLAPSTRVCYCWLEVKILPSIANCPQIKRDHLGLPGPQLLLFTQGPLFISSFKGYIFFPRLLFGLFTCHRLAHLHFLHLLHYLSCVGNRLVFTPVLPSALLE